MTIEQHNKENNPTGATDGHREELHQEDLPGVFASLLARLSQEDEAALGAALAARGFDVEAKGVHQLVTELVLEPELVSRSLENHVASVRNNITGIVSAVTPEAKNAATQDFFKSLLGGFTPQSVAAMKFNRLYHELRELSADANSRHELASLRNRLVTMLNDPNNPLKIDALKQEQLLAEVDGYFKA